MGENDTLFTPKPTSTRVQTDKQGDGGSHFLTSDNPLIGIYNEHKNHPIRDR